MLRILAYINRLAVLENRQPAQQSGQELHWLSGIRKLQTGFALSGWGLA
jgi:hypothetical protein